MKIALLHYSAPPVVGGVESVLGHHARLMAAAGHEVRVLAGRGGEQGLPVRFAALPLADSRHPDVLASKAQLDTGRLPPDFAGLAGRIEAGLRAALAGVDVLIAHNVCSLHKNLALTAALFNLYQSEASAGGGRPFRLLLWHHDLAWTTPRYRAELHDGYPWDLLRRDWPGARHVVVSELRRGELAALLALPPGEIAVVPSGVDAAAFLGLREQSAELVSRLGLWDAGPVLLLPVRITTRKNIELALRVLAALRRGPGTQRPFERAALVVTGPPGPHNPANAEYFARLKALRAELGLEGAAHFLAELAAEYLPDEVIADLYRVADAMIMPSREEGFGIPVLEAGLARLPVFCADIAPLRALGGAQATYFSPDADPEDVAGLIAGRLGGDRQFELSARVRAEYLWERVYASQIAPLLEP
jgi:glycosyltransferase involved in cell wall biosynthesis